MAEGHRERMRLRVRDYGLTSLQPHEILEYLLFPLIPRRETNTIAHALIKEFGSLDGVFSATPSDISRIKGMTENAALYLPAMKTAVRFAEQTSKKQVFALSNTKSLFDYYSSFLRGVREEQVLITALDKANAFVKTATIANGNSSMVTVNMKSVAQFVLDTKAVGVVLCHNHSHGNAEPSESDFIMTSNLFFFLLTLGSFLYDSIVVSENDIFSFRLAGAIGNTDEEQKRIVGVGVDYFIQRHRDIIQSQNPLLLKENFK